MEEAWRKYEISPHNPELLDQRVDYIASRQGWYRREQNNVDEGFRLSNDIKYIYLSGHGHEFQQYYVSNAELYTDDLQLIPEYKRTEALILPIHTEVALEVQIGREFHPCEKPVNPIKILVVEDSLFQQKLYSARLKMYEVTLTSDISQVSREYDLVFLSGSHYCDQKVDHDCVLRFRSHPVEGQPDNYLIAPLTEEKLNKAIRGKIG